MKESDLYRPLQVPSELNGLDQEVICGLKNTILEYGIPAGAGTCLTLRSKEPNISLTVSSHLTNRTIILIANNATEEGSFVVRLANVEGFEPAMLIWDKRISVQAAAGIIERAAEIRKEMDQAIAKGEVTKLSVDEIFHNPGTVYPIFPDGSDPEDVLAEFDKPEELVIVHELSFPVIVRRRDMPYLDQRRRVVLEVLKDQQIELEDVWNLSVEQILQIRKLVEARLLQ